jgi:GH43 family beta-xylosidase
MAKSGRYSADRKKIEVISGNKTIEVADCGTIFTIGSASATLTLPTMAAAGKGWWCRFVVNDESQAVTINKAAADTANQMVGNVITLHLQLLLFKAILLKSQQMVFCGL